MLSVGVECVMEGRDPASNPDKENPKNYLFLPTHKSAGLWSDKDAFLAVAGARRLNWGKGSKEHTMHPAFQQPHAVMDHCWGLLWGRRNNLLAPELFLKKFISFLLQWDSHNRTWF